MNRLWVFVVVVGVLSGCSNLRVVEHNPNQVVLSEFSTFSWQELPLESVDGSRLATADIAIREAVNNQLTAKGYQLVETGADFLINWRVGRAEVPMFEEQVYTVDDSLGDTMQRAMTHEGDVFLASPGVVEIDQLVLVFLDSNQVEPLLGIEIRGVHDEGSTDSELQERINEAVEVAFESIPAK